MVAATCVLIAAAYYVSNIRTTQRNMRMNLETRQAQLFMQIFNRFNEPDFFEKFTQILSWKWVDYDDFLKKYGGKTNPEAWYSEGSIAAFFEGVGLLVYLQLLDVKLAHALLFRHVKLFWEKMKPISLEMRRQLTLPHIDQWVEYLYIELIKIEEKELKS